jgi:hypothetical protein
MGNFAPDKKLSTGPADNLAAITPHDTTELEFWTRGIYVGGAGDIAVVSAAGDAITIVGCLAGVVYPFAVKIIKATGTTATDLIGLY